MELWSTLLVKNLWEFWSLESGSDGGAFQEGHGADLGLWIHFHLVCQTQQFEQLGGFCKIYPPVQCGRQCGGAETGFLFLKSAEN